MHRALAQIEAAFADAPRPPNDDLLHEQCMDDNDIVRLYPLEHWRDMPDDLVESEYAALAFLSPDGFRHFIPAYMGFTLRRLDSGAAAVDSTIWSLAPVFYEDEALKDFAVSKVSTLTGEPARRRDGLPGGGPRARRRVRGRPRRRRARLVAGAGLGRADVLVDRGSQAARRLGSRPLERPHVALEERDHA